MQWGEIWLKADHQFRHERFYQDGRKGRFEDCWIGKHAKTVRYVEVEIVLQEKKEIIT